ncbi:PREDICTED: protogenin-like, partial [Wasmannia auropunctata]|uniref:protogenin-like n=1 Tax=Wasmannia auropunctata TaxID=64793 RepID=UPI0005EDC912
SRLFRFQFLWDTTFDIHISSLLTEGGKEEISPPEPGNSTSVEITKLLEPYTNYSFYVRVWNNYAASDQSATIVCSTAPSVPKGTPKINVDIISSTKLNISWEPLSSKESRGVIVDYKLLWKPHQSSSRRVEYIPASTEYHILPGLKPGAQYDIRVLARTKLGDPIISESQLDWVTVTMPSSESNQFTIRNVVDIQILIVNASLAK